MSVYILNLISIFIWYMILKYLPLSKKATNILFIFIVTLQLIVLTSIRDYSVGLDTYNYVTRYQIIAGSSWESLPDLTEPLSFELGYIYLNKMLSLISSDPRFLLIVTSIFIFTSIGIFIYKNSENALLSYFIFIAMGYWGNSLNALRQYIAISIILFAIDFLKNQNPIKFFILVIIAALIHNSAIFALVLYPLSLIPMGKVYNTLLVVCSLGVVLFANQLTSIGVYIFGYESLATRLGEGSGSGMMVLLLCIAIGAQIIYKNSEIDIPDFAFYLKIVHVGIIINLLALNFSMFGRLMMYFTIILIVLVPNTIFSFKKPIDIVISSTIVIVFISIFYFNWILGVDSGGVVPYFI